MSGHYDQQLKLRHGRGRIMMAIFLASTFFAVIALAVLIFSIVDQTAGFVLTEYENTEEMVFPMDADGQPRELASLNAAELREIISNNIRPRRLSSLEAEKPLSERSEVELENLVVTEVLKPEVVKTWDMVQSIFGRRRIFEEAKTEYPNAKLSFRWWLNPDFFMRSQSSNALYAGVRSAILGSFITILITILVAFPIGVGAAIYLEEYAKPNPLNRIIQTNIYNLSGVPSIIYGMLGLGIFVRALEPLTSGALFGITSDGSGNGRTILSASLTLALLILPIIIINAQEAIRAVPRSMRESAYALGATRWQVIWHHVLPASMDRILTGTVLAVSRAIGETAPLVVVGASTFLTKDPTSIFSKFTTLPIQIYQWTARPQEEFRNIAAAAILVLMVLLLSLNASAIILRDRLRREKRLA